MTRILSFQAAWACRHSGACCTSAWPIPVEPRSEAAIRDGLASARLRVRNQRLFDPARDLPDGARSLLAHDDAGRCAFFDEPSRLCAIHRDLGDRALPLACRQFPRVALLEAASISLSLSHYCPTAAALLFESSGPVAIVENPPSFPANAAYDGLDVRTALPPLLRPGVLMSARSYALFEARGIATLTAEGASISQAVSRLVATADALTRWTLQDGDWDAFAERVLGQAPVERAAHTSPQLLWEAAVAAIPAPSRRPGFVSPRVSDRELFESSKWTLAGPVKRYLAARLFATWSAYQSNGLRTTARLVEAAQAVLLVESARRASEPLDRRALQEAVRRSDLLLVHLADPAELSRRLERIAAG